MELSLPVTIEFASAREHQHPELARADQVSGESEERVRLADVQRVIQHVVGQILEFGQDASTNALQNVRHVAPLGAHGYELTRRPERLSEREDASRLGAGWQLRGSVEEVGVFGAQVGAGGFDLEVEADARASPGVDVDEAVSDDRFG